MLSWAGFESFSWELTGEDSRELLISRNSARNYTERCFCPYCQLSRRIRVVSGSPLDQLLRWASNFRSTLPTDPVFPLEEGSKAAHRLGLGR